MFHVPRSRRAARNGLPKALAFEQLEVRTVPSLAAPVSFDVGDDLGDRPQAIAATDLNGDGTLDLVTANSGFIADFGGISVLLGNANGSFQPSRDFPAGISPVSVTVADFNGDGAPDVAVANAVPSLGVSVLLGNGDGSFQAPSSYAAGLTPFEVTAGDFNADGRPDLATPNIAGNTVSVLLGNGDGSFQPKTDYSAGQQPTAVAVADLDGDGKQDLVAAANKNNAVAVLRGNGDGTFQATAFYAAG